MEFLEADQFLQIGFPLLFRFSSFSNKYYRDPLAFACKAAN